MNFEDFLFDFISAIHPYLPEGSTPSIHIINRNNGEIGYGISIAAEGSSESPLIYMEAYFNAYCSDVPMHKLIAHFMEQYKCCLPFKESFPNFPRDPEQLKQHIFVKIIHYERNIQWLKTLPHRQILDLAMIYELVFPHSNHGFGFSVITNAMMKSFKLTEEELYNIAWENMLHTNPPCIYTMQEIMVSSSPLIMYILSNHNKIHGAAYMLHTDTIQLLADQLKSDLFILPSSIHEVVLMPWTEDSNRERLNQMVKDTNDKILQPDELLSDHVYVYHRTTKEITMS